MQIILPLMNMFRYCAALSFVLLSFALCAADAPKSPDLKEVMDLIRANLSGATESDLNQAAVDGVLAKFRGKVRLTGDNQASPEVKLERLGKCAVIEDGIAFLRVSNVAEGLAADMKAMLKAFASTNKLKGVVLDLRFCDGEDYSAAVMTADLFLSSEKPLLNWGSGEAMSKKKDDAISLPVVVLVNKETVGAPEALAAVLRETGTALLFGNTTAGAAMTMRDFSLKNGQRLRIVSAPVKLGDGTELSLAGVKPDIEVSVSIETERAYQDDVYAVLATSKSDSTNRIRRPRISEADLVREKRDGVAIDESAAAREREPEKPVIRDPALARAVDVLKGLAVVRRGGS